MSEMSLHTASESGDILAVIALIERGATVNEKQPSGRSPLHFACVFGHAATAIALLDNGAVGVNDRSSTGLTPSYHACMSCTADVVLRMIRHGAILTAVDLQRFRDRPTVSQRSRRAQSKLPTSERTTGGSTRTMPCSCRA